MSELGKSDGHGSGGRSRQRRRVVCAHDCGQIINPDGVRAQVEGSILQTLSRVLVKLDRSRVMSVDWSSYPILTFSQVPKIEIELIAAGRVKVAES